MLNQFSLQEFFNPITGIKKAYIKNINIGHWCIEEKQAAFLHFSLDIKYRDFSRFPNSFFNKIYQTQSFQFFIIENFVVKFSINKIMHIHRYFIYLIALRIYFPYCYRGGFFIRIAFIVSGPGSERNRTRENH